VPILLDEKADPIDALRRHFTWLRDDLARDDYALGCMLGNFGAELGRSGTKVDEAVSGSLSQWIAAIAYAARRAAAQGQLPAGTDPEAAARFLGTSWEGAALLAKVTGTPTPVEDFFTVAFPRILGHPFAVPATTTAEDLEHADI
jgi:TetR/AcrR family transcriptional repressor of nem operon